MVGIVVASHGQLAAALVATAGQIVGELSQVATCTVVPGNSSEELRAEIRRCVESVEQGDGVLIFADLIGGSPCMQSLSLCASLNIEVVTGVNLPMLIKATVLRADGQVALRELAEQLTQYGQRNISCATQTLRSRVSAA
jgi:mannose PTS system EIIA component